MRNSILNLIYSILAIGLIFAVLKFKNSKIDLGPIQKEKESTHQNLYIILSPHFDDAVLSLGGLLGKQERKFLVATFFTKKPALETYTQWDKISGFTDSSTAKSGRTKENQDALKSSKAIIRNYNYPDFQYRGNNSEETMAIKRNIENDIENIIRENVDSNIFIYGPATFGSKITHPDHKILHEALVKVKKNSKFKNVHFFFYEDFPYVNQFVFSERGTLSNYLEKIDTVKLKTLIITLEQKELEEKISNINKYTSQIKAFRSFGPSLQNDLAILANQFYTQRCVDQDAKPYACEVVYEILNN